MDSIKKIFGRIFVLGCLVGSLTGCYEEDRAPLSGERTVQVQLDVHTRAVDASTGKPTDEEAALHSLRVYAFSDVDGRSTTVGHLYLDKKDLDNTTETKSFLMDLKIKAESTEQTLRFYAVANEGAMSTPGNEKTLDESTSEDELNLFTFTTLNRDTETKKYGLPMYATSTVSVNTNDVILQEEQTGHEGHYTLKKVEFALERPVGKLGVFAAKDKDETGELKITGLTMLEAGTRAYNYLMPQSEKTLKKSEMTGTGRFELTHSQNVVKAELTTTDDRNAPAKYTPVLDVPFYPFENPWGSNDLGTPGDEHGNILQIDYTFDGDLRQGMVYMPPIIRNKYYAVCCLIHNSGKITVTYTVADWDDGGAYELEFDYPSYDLLQPFIGGTAPYAQPTVYYNNDASSTAGIYSFRFKISGPVGQEWQPTLFDATTADYELSVYQKVDGVNTLITPPYVASDTEYEIRVRALKVDNVNKEFSLGIAYTPKWDPSGSSLLLVNMQSGETNWTGSTSTEKIVIKQVDIPTN